jgi:para-nitrobenzyl esterase
MKLLTSSLLIILILAALFTKTPAQDNNTILISSVKTEGGIIPGTAGTGTSVKVFRGVPFAAPPLGELRWKEPKPVKAWEGIKKCKSFGPSAMQGAPIPF